MSEGSGAIGSANPREGLVILLDAVGTKGIAVRDAATNVFADWDGLLIGLGAFVAGLRGAFGPESSSILSFSDTIYITVATTDYARAASSVAELSEFFFDALVKGILLRGAVAAGLFFQQGTKVFGPAVDEAAAWHEQANWLGIASAPSFSRQLDLLELNETGAIQFFVIMRKGGGSGGRMRFPAVR